MTGTPSLSAFLIASMRNNGKLRAPRSTEIDPDEVATQKLKVVLCGDAKTGKTKLFDRITKDKYTESYLQTIGSDYATTTRVVPGANVKMDLWDTAGSPEYRIVLPIFFHEADIVLIVYDVTELDSFQNISYYLRNAPIWSGNKEVDIAIIGSKIDSWMKPRVVTFEMTQEICESFKCKSFEVSSVTTQGIEEMLQKMLRTSLKRKRLLPLWLLGSKATDDDFDRSIAKDGIDLDNFPGIDDD